MTYVLVIVALLATGPRQMEVEAGSMAQCAAMEMLAHQQYTNIIKSKCVKELGA